MTDDMTHNAGEPQEPPLGLTTAETDLVNSLRALGTDGDRLIRDLIVLVKSLPRVPRRLMSDQVKDCRIRSGTYTAEQIDQAERELRGGALQSITIRGRVSAAWETISRDTVMRFLRLTAGEVQDLISRRRLYAIDVGGETRFPTWQLSAAPVGRIVPGLHRVLPNLANWDPQQIGGFFTTRQDGLIDVGRKTPAAWLEDGGDAGKIVEILDSEDYR